MITIPGPIPITIHPIFWLVAALLGWMNLNSDNSVEIMTKVPVWIVVILISLLVHEFGHALTALFFKQKARIDLVAFGGVTQRSGKKIKLWQDFIVVMNGPLAGLLLGFIAMILRVNLFPAHTTSIVAYALFVTYNICIVWTVLNLLPVIPLDGGRLLSILMEGIFGFRGIQIAMVISLVVSVLIGALAFIAGYMLMGSFLLLFAYESYRSFAASLGVMPHDRNEEIQQDLKKAESALLHGDKEEAQQLLQKIRTQTQTGVIFVTATQMLADISYTQGLYQTVFDLLYPIKNELDVNALRLLHQSAYKIGDWKTAVELGSRAYNAFPHYNTAVMNAIAYAHLVEERPTLGWLQCAIREGLPNLNEVLLKSEFDPFRATPDFQKLK